MFEIIQSVINTGSFELSDILIKIDTIWLQGSIDDDQREELIALAREKADPAASYAPLQKQIDDLAGKISDLAARVTLLESGSGEGPEPDTEEYPEYVQPTGAHDAYHNGDKVTYNGTKYTCIAPEGVACVWNPDTYPAYWQEVG